MSNCGKQYVLSDFSVKIKRQIIEKMPVLLES